MEKQNIENKLLKNLGTEIKSLSGLMGRSLKEVTHELTKDLTPKELIRYKEFNKKYLKLDSEGKDEEAQELKEAFFKQFSE